MIRLPIRVRQSDDEPAWSLLHRLARLAGTGSAKEFCYDMGLNFARVAAASDLQDFCDLGGFDLQQVEKVSIKTERHLIINGQRLPDGSLTNGEIRFCPQCLREDLLHGAGPIPFRPHWRDWWFVRDIEVCPFHHVGLFRSTTDNTRNRLAPTHLDPLDAGPDQRSADRIKTHEVTDVCAERYLVSRMGFGQAEPNGLLDPLPLDRAIMCIRSFGAAVLGGVPGDFEGDPRRVLTSGFRVLQSRNNLESFLDDRGDRFRASNPRIFTPVAVYGYLYSWLKRERSTRASGALLDDIRNIVMEHALRTFPVRQYSVMFGAKIVERHLHTFADIEHLTKVKGERLRAALVKLGLIDASTARPDRWEILFTAEEARLACETLARSRKGVQVRKDYSIPVKRFIELQRTGKLVPWLKLGIPEEDSCIWMEPEVRVASRTARGGS